MKLLATKSGERIHNGVSALYVSGPSNPSAPDLFGSPGVVEPASFPEHTEWTETLELGVTGYSRLGNTVFTESEMEVAAFWGTGQRRARLYRLGSTLVENRFPHSGTPSFVRASVREEFRRLAEEWKADTVFVSSTHEMILHPAYQQIIGLGPRVVPLICEELERETKDWFWALRALTRTDAAEEAGVAPGDIEATRAAWLSWARDIGVL